MAKTNAERQAAHRARVQDTRRRELLAKGLPPLPPVPSMPGSRRWNAMIDQARALLEAVRDEAEDYAADRSEAWQEGERGEAHTERLDALGSTLDALDGMEPW